MIGKTYQVYAEDNFYESMKGKCVFTTDKTILLEFKLSDSLGGTQRAMFFKDQVAIYSYMDLG
ncbi:hypothetical protein CHI02_23785 [Niallia circulans]|uniref:hypothetical protein n=1 Tax=Niallia circulans TaxID=1397 RepID=UPI000BA60C56|nr:hypothetical protein [Niallia circulans]PAE09704.1 hypothetical protein CHI02_23785 [Niallia circulans]